MGGGDHLRVGGGDHRVGGGDHLRVGGGDHLRVGGGDCLLYLGSRLWRKCRQNNKNSTLMDWLDLTSRVLFCFFSHILVLLTHA